MSFSYFYQFCSNLLFINIHIFDYPDPRLSGLFRVVPTSQDNRGSTVISLMPFEFLSPGKCNFFADPSCSKGGLYHPLVESMSTEYNSIAFVNTFTMKTDLIPRKH